MKKIIYAVAITCLLGTVSTYAGTVSVNSENTEIQQKEKKKKVTEDELPTTIKNLFKSDEYKDWKITQAYLMDPGEYYKIELKKDDQTQTLNLDKYGNKVSVIE